jgi:hypothetical protein
MKNFDSRTYSINDFLEWSKNDQLELNPRFQRRSVWTDSARSYLIDTIVRGKPIPKVFIRQKLNFLVYFTASVIVMTSRSVDVVESRFNGWSSPGLSHRVEGGSAAGTGPSSPDALGGRSVPSSGN